MLIVKFSLQQYLLIVGEDQHPTGVVCVTGVGGAAVVGVIRNVGAPDHAVVFTHQRRLRALHVQQQLRAVTSSHMYTASLNKLPNLAKNFYRSSVIFNENLSLASLQ